MNKTGLFLIYLMFTVSLLNAQVTLGEWECMLSETDFQWAQGFERYIQDRLDSKEDQSAFFPSLYATPSYTFSAASMKDPGINTQSLSLGITSSQKLPTGGVIGATVTQSLSLTSSDSQEYGYSANGELSLSQPFLDTGFWSYHDFSKDDGKETRWIAFRMRRVAQTLFDFLNTAVLYQRQETNKLLIYWHEKAQERDRALYENGHMSLDDLVRARSDSVELERQYQSNKLKLTDYRNQMVRWPYSPVGIDIELWLDKLELDVAQIQKTAVEYEWDTMISDLHMAISDLIEDEIDNLPSITLNANFSPNNRASENTNVWSSIYYYWNSDLPLAFSVNLSFLIPIVPWDSYWNVPKRFASLRRANELKINEYQTQKACSIELIREKINLNVILVSQTERTYSLEKDRYELYEIKLKNGDLSDMDVEYQKIQMLNALLDLYSARIELLRIRIIGE